MVWNFVVISDNFNVEEIYTNWKWNCTKLLPLIDIHNYVYVIVAILSILDRPIRVWGYTDEVILNCVC